MKYNKIILPTSLQVDTTIAIFILRKFGHNKDTFLENSFKLIISPLIEGGKSVEDVMKQGILPIDIGGGPFDHHGKEKTTVSKIVSEYFGVENDPCLVKLLSIAERDDMYGKGTLSEDVLDKAFGLPSVVGNLNRMYENSPEKVFLTMEPILEAHYNDEFKRNVETPNLADKLKKDRKLEYFTGFQNGKRLKIAFFNSDDKSLCGYLRSYKGGRCDVVVQFLSTGHTNVITRQDSKINLVELIRMIRSTELLVTDREVLSGDVLRKEGRVVEIPEWYYDTATTSILNGGLNPGNVSATKIPENTFRNLIKIVFDIK